MTPMGNRIFVEPILQVLGSGLILPEDYAQHSRVGIVRAVGNGRRSRETGKRVPITSVKIDDRVLLPYNLGPGSRPIMLDGRECFSIILEELLGVLTDGSTEGEQNSGEQIQGRGGNEAKHGGA